ncbi:MAG: histidine kinase dimerization/phosphoacceptor domain -containing protein [Acetobacteraceae bacterium]
MITEPDRTVEKLLRQQAALAGFGSFAFKETDLLAILMEAARVCASCLGVAYCKVCRYRPAENDLLVVAGCGWDCGVVGQVVSRADETSPQGRAYVTREPVIIHDLRDSNNLALPDFYPRHGIISTVDVIIPAIDGAPYGVLEIDSPALHHYDVHDIDFLTGFANVLATAVATAQRNKAMLALVDQQKLLAEELQHRVRNNLLAVSGMLANYARTAVDDTTRVDITSISRRVVTLAQIYDSLLGVGLSKTIDFGGYLRELCAALPGLQDDRISTIDLQCRAEFIMLSLETVTALGIVVAELVTNSYRHAFPDRRGTITVTLVRSPETGRAILTIRDSGVGFAVEAIESRRGLGLVRRLIEQVGGTLNVQSEAGARWTIGFDVPVGIVGLVSAAS